MEEAMSRWRSKLKQIIRDQEDLTRLYPEAESLGIDPYYDREIEPGWTVKVQKSYPQLMEEIVRARNA
jgi:hypothetical protein